MPPLRLNLSELTRMQRHWSSLLTPADGDETRLTETEGFGSNPGDLRMLRYSPAALPAGAPLVVVLHGCGQTAGGYNSGTGWSELAERHGFAVLLPEQRRGNNAHGCFNWFEPGDTARGEGELASIRQMVAHVQGELAIDPTRIFVTGLSAGGAMTSALLAAYPDVFAGGAIIAGLPYGAASGVHEALGAMHRCRVQPGQAWGDLVRAASPLRAGADRPRVAIWHGDADQTVAPCNALESAKQWVNVHGLREADGVENRIDGVLHRIWRNGTGAPKVELYAIPGLGHGTPITPNADGDRGVGHAAPYILDAGIASTWHIAQSWNLLGPDVARPERSKPATARPASPAELVKRGLRAAGLL